MIHVGMNIEEKGQLMSEAFRVLNFSNYLVVFDVMKCKDTLVEYPLPWAERREDSAVDTIQSYKDALSKAGFNTLNVEDKNQFALDSFETIITKMKEAGPKPLGRHLLMGDNTKEKIMNMHKQVREKILPSILIIAQK